MGLNRGGVMPTAVDGLRAFGAGVLAVGFARFTHPTYGRPVATGRFFFVALLAPSCGVARIPARPFGPVDALIIFVKFFLQRAVLGLPVRLVTSRSCRRGVVGENRNGIVAMRAAR